MAESYMEKLKNFLKECKRVLLVTKKPSSKEFKMAAKITGLGMLLIGFVGMLIKIAGALITGTG